MRDCSSPWTHPPPDCGTTMSYHASLATKSPSSEPAMSNIYICKGSIKRLLDDTLLMQAADYAVRQGVPP